MSACVPAFKLWLACWQTNIFKEVIKHMSIKRADLGQIIPTITFDTNVAILDPTASPSISNTGTALNQVLKLSVPKGEKGDTGSVGPQGPKGDKGDDFKIYKTYTDVQSMENDYASVPEGAFVIIGGKPLEGDSKNVDVNDPDVGKLYVRNAHQEGETNGKNAFTYLTDLSGAQGIKGEKGDKGDKGEDGVDGKDGVTYSYSFATGDNGHLYIFFDDEGKDPTSQNAGMKWENWTATQGSTN